MDNADLEKQKHEEEIKDQVLKELAEARKKHGTLENYFNNFELNLCNAYRYQEDPAARWMVGEENWNKPHGTDSEQQGINSDRYWKETPNTFYSTLREKLQKLGLSLEDLQKLGSSDIDRNELLVPIYIRLRQMGYSHYDLVG